MLWKILFRGWRDGVTINLIYQTQDQYHQSLLGHCRVYNGKYAEHPIVILEGICTIMHKYKIKGIIWRIITILSMLAVVLPLISPFIYPWSRLNCFIESIDVMTGRYQKKQYIWWICISEEIKDTDISKAYMSYYNDTYTPQWRIVNVISLPLRSSPQYKYHRAFNAADELMHVIERADYDEEERKIVINTFIKMLQYGDDSYAREYVRMIKDNKGVNGDITD